MFRDLQSSGFGDGGISIHIQTGDHFSACGQDMIRQIRLEYISRSDHRQIFVVLLIADYDLGFRAM